MEAILEVVLQLVLELVAELCGDVVLRRLAAQRGFGRALFYGIVGGVAGAFSLLVAPAHLMPDTSLRVVALMVNPVLIGLLMARLGRWRARRDKPEHGLEAFWPAWAFALCLGLVRVLWAK